MAWLAKPPDCGHDWFATGAGRVTLIDAASLSGSSSRRSANTGTRSPTSTTFFFSNSRSRYRSARMRAAASRKRTASRAFYLPSPEGP